VKRAFLVMLVVGVFAGLSLVGVAYDPETFVNVTSSGYVTLDPCEAYDTASGAILDHVYERLVEYVADDVYVIPGISTEVPTVENGLLVINEDGTATFKFPIRQGVKFHDGADLTPSDVVYSLKRNLLADPLGGPQWMPWSIFNRGGADDDALEYLNQHIFIDPADANVVVIEAEFYAPFILQILAGSWCSIMDEDYVIAQGGWDGGENWKDWNALPEEDNALYDNTNGSGSWILDSADSELGFSLQRNEEYWGEKPILKRVEVVYDNEWTNRRLMLENGDADVAYIPINYKPQVEGTPGFRTVYNLPSITNGAFQFTFEIAMEGNDRVGSGQLDGAGIPSDFWQDIHMRKAAAYIFPYDQFIEEVTFGESIVPPTMIPTALPYAWQEDKRVFFTDKEKAIEELKLAWDGAVWENGFFFELNYNTGNDTRKTGCEMMRNAFFDIDYRFNILVRGIPWPQYLEANKAHALCALVIGWLPDYPDADNYANPYYYSDGYFAYRSVTSALLFADAVDERIIAASKSSDPAVRGPLYDEIQQIVTENCVMIPLQQATARVWMRRWVANYVYAVHQSGGWNYDVVYKTADGSDGALHPSMANIRHTLEEW